jgi:hypothetical protein
MMRKPNAATLTSDAALLLSLGIGLLVRHVAITRAEGSASGSEWSSAEPQSSAEWSSISLIGRLRVTTIADASRGSGDARDAAQRTRSHRGERYRSVLAEFAAAAMSLIRIIRCSGSVGEGSKPWRR